MPAHWLADRTRLFDASGIRKVFDLGAKLTNPINLSIGQPDFDVPEPVRQAAIDAIQSRKNGYALTQGMPVLREKLQAQVDRQYGHADRELFVTSRHQRRADAGHAGAGEPRRRGDRLRSVLRDVRRRWRRWPAAKVVYIDTYPDFRIDLDRVAEAITPRTKVIIFNSPANPTGAVASEEEVRGLAELAAERNVVLMSDEIYRAFCYDRPFVSPAKYNPQTLVVDGFSKTYGMPGWRLGFAHGPSAIIREMIKLQQYSFVCAPQPLQWAGAAALDVDMTPHIAAYRRKRDLLRRRAGRRLRTGRARRGVLRLSQGCPGARARSSSPGRSRSTNC